MMLDSTVAYCCKCWVHGSLSQEHMWPVTVISHSFNWEQWAEAPQMELSTCHLHFAHESMLCFSMLEYWVKHFQNTHLLQLLEGLNLKCTTVYASAGPVIHAWLMLNLTYKLGQGCIDLEEGVVIIVIVNPFVCDELLLLSPVFVVRPDFLCVACSWRHGSKT